MASGAFELEDEAERQALGTWLPNAHDDHLSQRPYGSQVVSPFTIRLIVAFWKGWPGLLFTLSMGSRLSSHRSPHFLPMRSFPIIYLTYIYICTYPALSLLGLEQVALILKSDKGRHRCRPLHSHGLPQNVRFRDVRASIHSWEVNNHPTFAFHCHTYDDSVFAVPRTNHILQYSCEVRCHLGPLPAEARPQVSKAKRLSTVGSGPRRLSSANHLLLPQTYLSVFAMW
ncbi:hypothetical protein EDB89DRAFT_1334676 [Lactarius sanguifluus]|nr:hypothetical protein EDB89DRAFT_1334676 [Lactarius sanguifluus]